MKKRCSWVNLKNEKYILYHDLEWWKKIFDDKILFEMLTLEWAQSWLSWETILSKRETYREVFDFFDVKKILNYDSKKIEKLLKNPWIIRNKLKINSVIKNAKVFLDIQNEFWSFSDYIWSFVNFETINNYIEKSKDAPAKTEISEKISKELKKRGMSFVWPTIIYSFMQAVWMVNDHENDCFCKNIY